MCKTVDRSSLSLFPIQFSTNTRVYDYETQIGLVWMFVANISTNWSEIDVINKLNTAHNPFICNLHRCGKGGHCGIYILFRVHNCL